jgi:hydroxyethylthiazole kinase-like sugar kinase family protein
MSDDLARRVERACATLTEQGAPVTFDAVAARARLGRTTLYRRAELRAIVDEHRLRAREAHTLSGLDDQITQLRGALEAVAELVRRHEEILRRIDRRDRQTR